MNAVLVKFLAKRFPSHFRDLGGDMRNTCMAWGIEHGSGWFQLLFDCNEEIADYMESEEFSHIKEKPDFYWSQIKEKYGTARWYFDGGDTTIEKIVSKYESATARTCEECGDPGEIRGKGWYSTRCNKCWKSEQKRLKEVNNAYMAKQSKALVTTMGFDQSGNVVLNPNDYLKEQGKTARESKARSTKSKP